MSWDEKDESFILDFCFWFTKQNQIRVICFKIQATLFTLQGFDSLKTTKQNEPCVLGIGLYCSFCMFLIHFKNQAALFMRFLIPLKISDSQESFVSGNNLQCLHCKVLINNQILWVINYENKATLFMQYAFDWQ